MIHRLRLRYEVWQLCALGDFGLNHPQSWVLQHRVQVLQTSGRKVIQDHDAVAVREQSFHEMGADEPSASCYEDGPRRGHGGTDAGCVIRDASKRLWAPPFMFTHHVSRFTLHSNAFT